METLKCGTGLTPEQIYAGLKGASEGEKLRKAVGIYSDDPEADIKSVGESYSEDEAESKRLKELGGKTSVGLSKNDRKSTKEFVGALSSAKSSVSLESAWRVSSPSEEGFDEEHPDARKYVTKGGSTVAITTDGDIVGLCHNSGDTIRGKEILLFAVQNGGKKLDAFSGLYGFYSKYGFEPVSWTPFDEQYAPPGWTKGRDKEEPVIFWKYTGKRPKYKNSDEFMENVAASESYDSAKHVRDLEL